MAKKSLPVQVIDEDHAQKVADIMGRSSAHARAISELVRRRMAGEDVCLVTTGFSVLVVPRSSLSAPDPADLQ